MNEVAEQYQQGLITMTEAVIHVSATHTLGPNAAIMALSVALDTSLTNMALQLALESSKVMSALADLPLEQYRQVMAKL